MKPRVILGFSVLAAVWLWLVWPVLRIRPFTGIHLFWIIASGIIIFVPLWKKYVRGRPGEEGGAKGDCGHASTHRSLTKARKGQAVERGKGEGVEEEGGRNN